MSHIDALLNLISKETTTKENLELALKESLKDTSFNINEPHETGWTLLTFATYLRRKDLVQVLINQPNIQINKLIKHITPTSDFFEPTSFQQFNVKLIEVNSNNIARLFSNILHTGISALYITGANPNPELAQLLIDKGADVNLCSTLQFAVKNKNEKLVKTLLSHPNIIVDDKTKPWLFNIGEELDNFNMIDRWEILNHFIQYHNPTFKTISLKENTPNTFKKYENDMLLILAFTSLGLPFINICDLYSNIDCSTVNARTDQSMILSEKLTTAVLKILINDRNIIETFLPSCPLSINNLLLMYKFYSYHQISINILSNKTLSLDDYIKTITNTNSYFEKIKEEFKARDNIPDTTHKAQIIILNQLTQGFIPLTKNYLSNIYQFIANIKLASLDTLTHGQLIQYLDSVNKYYQLNIEILTKLNQNTILSINIGQDLISSLWKEIKSLAEKLSSRLKTVEATKATSPATTSKPKPSTSATAATPPSRIKTMQTDSATASPPMQNDESTELATALLKLKELEKVKKSIDDKKNHASHEIAKNNTTITSLADKSSVIDADILVVKQQQQETIKVRDQKQASMQKQIDALQSDLDATTKSNVQIEDNIKNGATDIEKIKKAILEKETLLFSESKRTSDLKTQTEKLTAQCTKKTSQLSKLKAENIVLNKDITVLTQDKTNKMSQSTELEQEIKNLNLELEKILADKKVLQEEQQQANVILAKLSKQPTQQFIVPNTPVTQPIAYPYPIQPYPSYSPHPFALPYQSLPIPYPHQSAAHAPMTGYIPSSDDVLADLNAREQFLIEKREKLEQALTQIKQKPIGTPASTPQFPTQPSIQSPPGFMIAQQSGLTLFNPAPRIPNHTGAQTLTPNQFFGSQK